MNTAEQVARARHGEWLPGPHVHRGLLAFAHVTSSIVILHVTLVMNNNVPLQERCAARHVVNDARSRRVVRAAAPYQHVAQP